MGAGGSGATPASAATASLGTRSRGGASRYSARAPRRGEPRGHLAHQPAAPAAHRGGGPGAGQVVQRRNGCRRQPGAPSPRHRAARQGQRCATDRSPRGVRPSCAATTSLRRRDHRDLPCARSVGLLPRCQSLAYHGSATVCGFAAPAFAAARISPASDCVAREHKHACADWYFGCWGPAMLPGGQRWHVRLPGGDIRQPAKAGAQSRRRCRPVRTPSLAVGAEGRRSERTVNRDDLAVGGDGSSPRSSADAARAAVGGAPAALRAARIVVETAPRLPDAPRSRRCTT